MAQDIVVGTDSGVTAILTKINGDITELFVTQTEVVTARTSTVTAETHASLDARLEAIETDISAIAAGSGVLVSANDTTIGVLNGKLVAGEAIDFTEGNDGGNETLTILCEDASTINKGVAELATAAEAIAGTDTGRIPAVSVLMELLKYHFLI